MLNIDISSQITPEINQLKITNEKSSKLNNGNRIEGKWGLALTEVYKLALKFYKEKEGKAIQLSYEDKLQLVAFAQQVSHGPLATSKVPPVGALDVVGRDRRLAWQKLGDLSIDQARAGFVELLTRRCPHFDAYIEAHRCENEEKQRKAQEEAMLEMERKKQRDEEAKRQCEREAQQEREEIARRKIQQALNEQTYEQFRIYAEQQFPGDAERQSDLVKQLQDQHYLQYMQQLQATVNQQQQQQQQLPQNNNKIDENREISDSEHKPDDDNLDDPYFEGMMYPASMWTRDDIQQFKDTVTKSDGDGVIRVGHGETVTVRVPTTKAGSQIFWEFATDHYDIGFGVYFEWGTPITDQVLVHVSESEEDDEDDDEYENSDPESGGIAISASTMLKRNSLTSPDFDGSHRSRNTPVLSEIVPIYRRDCHLQVYVGCHTYVGEGCYLLKFDNSYSLWRSKTLYYRVCYPN